LKVVSAGDLVFVSLTHELRFNLTGKRVTIKGV